MEQTLIFYLFFCSRWSYLFVRRIIFHNAHRRFLSSFSLKVSYVEWINREIRHGFVLSYDSAQIDTGKRQSGTTLCRSSVYSVLNFFMCFFVISMTGKKAVAPHFKTEVEVLVEGVQVLLELEILFISISPYYKYIVQVTKK